MGESLSQQRGTFGPETCTGLNLRPVPGPARELRPGPARGPRKLPISGPGPPAARAIEARPGSRIEACGRGNI